MNKIKFLKKTAFLLPALLALSSPLFLLAQEGRRGNEEPSALHVNVDVVNLFFTVSDSKGRLITDLKKEEFQVEEDGKRQEISHFSREVSLPLTMAILIDCSLSVEPILSLEKQTAVEFLQTVLRKEDLALVMEFDHSVSMLQDFTSQVSLLEKAIRDISIGKSTSLHDAIYLAANEKLKYEAGRKAIIVISDGADNASKVKLNDALEAAQRADVIIYAISNTLGGAFFSKYERDDGILKKYAEATGGKAFFPSKPQDLKKAFDEIQTELRSQYNLAYSSTNQERDGKYRAISVSLPHNRDLKIRVRKGYYAGRS